MGTSSQKNVTILIHYIFGQMKLLPSVVAVFLVSCGVFNLAVFVEGISAEPEKQQQAVGGRLLRQRNVQRQTECFIVETGVNYIQQVQSGGTTLSPEDCRLVFAGKYDDELFPYRCNMNPNPDIPMQAPFACCTQYASTDAPEIIQNQNQCRPVVMVGMIAASSSASSSSLPLPDESEGIEETADSNDTIVLDGPSIIAPTDVETGGGGGQEQQQEEQQQQQQKEEEDTALVDIPGTAIAAGSFETLVAALIATDLVEALSAPNGPFTVFAPTDAAFDAAPVGLLDCLLADIPTLTNILLYHVLSFRTHVLAAQLTDGMEIATLLEGQSIRVKVDEDGSVRLNNDVTTVTTPDVPTSNGVIHIIDQVLVPPSIDISAYLETCRSSGTGTIPSGGSASTTDMMNPPPPTLDAGSNANGGSTDGGTILGMIADTALTGEGGGGSGSGDKINDTLNGNGNTGTGTVSDLNNILNGDGNSNGNTSSDEVTPPRTNESIEAWKEENASQSQSSSSSLGRIGSSIGAVASTVTVTVLLSAFIF